MFDRESLTYHLRDAYWSSTPLQRAYSALASACAPFQNNLFDRLDLLASAARRVREPRTRARKLAAFSAFVQREFAKAPPHGLARNVFVQAYLKSAHGQHVRATVEAWSLEKRERLGGNVIVLKTPQPGEKGVLLIKYTPYFRFFLANFDLARINAEFRLVLAPSWYLYPLPYWALFADLNDPTLITCFDEEMAGAIRDSGFPVIPVALGSQDWVDTEVFRPLPGVPKDFDVVMVASFQRLKRHDVLFRALQKLRPRRLKIALIGATWERTRDQFDEQIASFGLQHDCTIFQGLSPEQVNEVLNRAKVKVLLSKIEGGNKSVMEALAAGTPCLVYEGLIGRRDLTERSGMYTSDAELPEKLLYMVENHHKFEARACMLSRSGVERSTEILNAALRRASADQGEPWTRDIVAALHRFAGLAYRSEENARSVEAGWEVLRRFVRSEEKHAFASA